MGNFGNYGGYPGFGGYRPGIGYGDPNSLGQRMESGTMATFQLLESIVGTFGGFAQMLESTFMATHSSFYAMLVSFYSLNRQILIIIGSGRTIWTFERLFSGGVICI